MTSTEARARLLALLRELAYEERDVVLSSGLRSTFYIDCKQVTLDAEGAALLGQVATEAVRRHAPSARGVGGLTLGADPIATAIAVHSAGSGDPLHAFIVRKEPKGHGTGRWVERPRRLAAGSAVVVVEDVVTTGASTLRAIERAEEDGLRVVHALTLVDRDEGGGAAVRAKVPLTALFSRAEIVGGTA